MTCARCGDHGVIRVDYQSGEPFDLVLCVCRPGQWYRSIPDEALRQWISLSQEPLGMEHQIGLLEDVDDSAAPNSPPSPDFVEAGRSRKRAKL